MAEASALSLDFLLDVLWETRGTDLLLSAGTHPRVRVAGELRAVPDAEPLAPADTERVARSLLSEPQWAGRTSLLRR